MIFYVFIYSQNKLFLQKFFLICIIFTIFIMLKKYIIAIIILWGFTSCINSRYITKHEAIPAIVYDVYKTQPSEYKLQPYDYLYISIKTTNKEINELYEKISSTFSAGLANNEANFFLTGYLINDSGYVSVPTLGKLYVKGLTIEQTRSLIQNEVSKILNDAVVNVRLTSFNVTFLGEVTRQGRIPFYKEKVNILEAIGSAGGLTYYGNKRNVMIIRPQDTIMKVYTVNLTNAHILEQKEFFLYPNDIVYVPPKRSKNFFEFSRDYSSIISMITGTISTTLLIMQLTKNSQ